MCTIQGIKDAIRENYQSQYDMNPLTLTGFCSLCRFIRTRTRLTGCRRPSVSPAFIRIAERHSLFHERLWLILCQKSERSEVNGGLSD